MPLDFGLRDWARREPTRTAIVRADGTRVTYGALDRLANQLAHLIRAAGLVRGDHVAGVLGNDPLFAALVWACWRAGVYFTPISTYSSPNDALYIARNCEARLVVVDQRFADVAHAIADALQGQARVLTHDASGANEGELGPVLAEMPDTPLEQEEPGGLMMYTSGTTGAPKGVWRPLPDSCEGAPTFSRDLIDIYKFPADARFFSPAPLYHAAPLRFTLAMLTVGASVYLFDRFDASKALDLVEKEGISHSLWVPTMLQRVLNLPAQRRAAFRAPRHVMALHCAAPCPVPLKQAMMDWWGPILYEFYGGTESVGLCAITPQEWLSHPGSVGRAHRGTIHVLGDGDIELPAGATGRIAFSGSSLFEYFGDPAKTASRLSAQGYQTFGDIGYVDAEGFLYLTDRLDDMIISGGVNIYPQEVENALMEAPHVSECAVVGLPDAEYGERVVAFVVLRNPATDADQAANELDDFCKQRLGSIKRPKEYRFITTLPRSAVGKLLRRELKRADPTSTAP